MRSKKRSLFMGRTYPPDERHIPVFDLKRVFPGRLRLIERWVSVGVCYFGSVMPVFSDTAYNYSMTLTGMMLGALTVGLMAGINVLISDATLALKLVVTPGVLFCTWTLFMVFIAGSQ
jgi:hypothetical protein